MMRVYLSFDVEVWCDGWSNLDSKFPASFDRYVYGRSAKGDYALPKTLEILQNHGLRGVFFVEPLFAARFGEHYLAEIVDLIRNAQQDVQLHLHPEWADEIRPLPIPGATRKRQHLCYYDLSEQTVLIALGKHLLQAAGGAKPTTFRAGSYAANADTFRALRANGIALDSSLNSCFEISGHDIARDVQSNAPLWQDGVQSYPISVYRDGLGRARPAQVNAAGFDELRATLLQAERQGQTDFVIVSHNFELLKPGSNEPDPVVVRRFRKLCAFLARHADRFEVSTFAATQPPTTPQPWPRAPLASTLTRHIEQLWRRL